MSEIVKLNLEITIPKRWVNKFIQMFDCMRWCGKVGASRCLGFYADGDGDFRPFDFKVNGKEIKSDIPWHKFDKTLRTKEDQELPQPFKTKRDGVDFFFDAG